MEFYGILVNSYFVFIVKSINTNHLISYISCTSNSYSFSLLHYQKCFHLSQVNKFDLSESSRDYLNKKLISWPISLKNYIPFSFIVQLSSSHNWRIFLMYMFLGLIWIYVSNAYSVQHGAKFGNTIL